MVKNEGETYVDKVPRENVSKEAPSECRHVQNETGQLSLAGGCSCEGFEVRAWADWRLTGKSVLGHWENGLSRGQMSPDFEMAPKSFKQRRHGSIYILEISLQLQCSHSIWGRGFVGKGAK